MAALTTLVSLQDLELRTRERLNLVKTRPSTRAAEAFFAESRDGDASSNLPDRVHRLAEALRQWTALPGSPELSSSLSSDPFESRRLAWHAAVANQAEKYPSFWKTMNAFFQTLPEGIAADLDTLGWIQPPDGLLYSTLQQAMRDKILQHCRDSIKGDYESDQCLHDIFVWSHQTLLPWLTELQHQETITQNLRKLITECFVEVRCEEIFEIVADYPDSQAAIHELCQCLKETQQYSLLGQGLKASLVRRLTHVGANTSQIIDVYISTIKVLRHVDPSDRLLSFVAEPVRKYLQGRHDTIRCIIHSLTDVDSDLYRELRRLDAKPLEDVIGDSDDEEEPPTMEWQPRPSIFQPQGAFLEGTGARSDSDILAMLVSIYGSKELFVQEYRVMLADKLLQQCKDYNTDEEVHTLELLKLRFGDASMRNAEVMIKDMEDSKRTNSNIHSAMQTTVDAVILSHIFWPSLQDENMIHHPRIRQPLDEFGRAYGRLKTPRKLFWMNQLGSVDLELVVQGQDGPYTKAFSCSPILATLISHFEDRESWTSEELSDETGLPEHIIQKRMVYWVNNRVIIANSHGHSSLSYRIASDMSQADGGDAIEDEDGEDQAVSGSSHQKEEMEVYTSYIVGMLTNLGQLPLKTIHNNLKTFVAGSDLRYTQTPQQLSAFLQSLCQQEKLECGPDGLYRLVK